MTISGNRLPGDAELIRTASIGSREGWYLLMYLRRSDPEDRARSFLLCAGRFDTETGWRRFLKGLPEREPAEKFVLRNFGIPYDLSVFYSTRAWTNLDAERWLERKLRNRQDPRNFLREERDRKRPFPVGLGHMRANPGKWVVAKIPGKARGPGISGPGISGDGPV